MRSQAVNKSNLISERLDNLSSKVQKNIDEKLYDGAIILVGYRGALEFYNVFGWADRNNAREMVKNSIFYSMSAGKQFVSTLILNRIELGEFQLNTKVAKIIPEFGKKGKENITVSQILSHTSGLAGNVLSNLNMEDMGNLEAVVKAICDAVPEIAPGIHVHYSASAGHAVLGEILRRIEGGSRNFREIMKQDLFEPLGMKDTNVGKPTGIEDRICPVVVRDATYAEGPIDPKMMEAVNFIMNENIEIPAGGYTTTAEDMFNFAEMLRRGGELNDTRILSPAMIDYVSRNHTGEMTGLWKHAGGLRGWGQFPANLGLGYFSRGTGIHPTWFGLLANENTFGGIGSGSTCFWVDRKRDMSFVFMSTGLIEETRHVDRMQKYSDMIISSIPE